MKYRVASLLFLTFVVCLSVQAVSHPSVSTVFLGCIASAFAGAVHSTRSRKNCILFAAYSAIVYLSLPCIAAVAYRYRDFLLYTGSKPFFEDGILIELIIVPLIVFLLLICIIGPTGMLVGWIYWQVHSRLQGKARPKEVTLEPLQVE